jgi:hypothetical protein
MIGGYVVDPQGSPISGARVRVTYVATGAISHATTDANGRWVVLGMPAGRVHVQADAPGFTSAVRSQLEHRAGQATTVNFTLQVGSITETVEVTASASVTRNETRQIDKQIAQQQNQASPNVANLQRRVAGVLPIPVDVPKAGNSYRFVRALVLDEETKLTFSYKGK